MAKRVRPADLLETVDPVALDHPESAWNVAAAATPDGDPFCCRTEWQLSYHETFPPRRPLHIHATGDSVAAFAERLDPRLGTVLEPVEAHWMFGCPLLGPQAIELLQRLLRARHWSGQRPYVVLTGLLPEGELRARLGRSVFADHACIELESTVLCSASLDGGLDGFLSRRSGSWRRNLRAAGRRADARGVSFERCVPHDHASAEATYARMTQVERTSWKGIGRCGMLEPPSVHFYAAMLRRLAASRSGRVMFARHDGRDIGFIFGGLAGRIYRGQQFSYAEDWHQVSIGNLLAIEQIRWLAEEGVARYDMGPLMDYKRHWTETQRVLQNWLLAPE